MNEEEKENLEVHYLAYIVFSPSNKDNFVKPEYKYQNTYDDVEKAKYSTRKKLGGFCISFVIREVIFDDSTVVSDTEIYTENAVE